MRLGLREGSTGETSRSRTRGLLQCQGQGLLERGYLFFYIDPLEVPIPSVAHERSQHPTLCMSYKYAL